MMFRMDAKMPESKLSAVIVVILAFMFVPLEYGQVNGESINSAISYEELKRTNIPTMEVAIRSNKVFRFAFNPNLFGWPSGTPKTTSQHLYSYQPSLKGLPDMPYWMRYKYSHRHKAGIRNDILFNNSTSSISLIM